MESTSAHEVTSACSVSAEKRRGSTGRTHQQHRLKRGAFLMTKEQQ